MPGYVREVRRIASIAVAALVGLAACRGGVKSGQRAWETADATGSEAPAPAGPAAEGPASSGPGLAVPAGPPSLTPPVVRPQVWRIEYYKISDG